jgi:predicted hexulose-6-phosphate isomerase
MKKINDFGTNLIGIYEKAFPSELSWEERLEQARQAGYDFVEMSVDDSDERLARLNWDSSSRDSLRRSIEKTGIPILTMGLSAHRKYPLGSASDDVRKRGLEILHQAIVLAKDLGIRIIQLMGYDVFYEKSDENTKEKYLHGLMQGASWASAAGVMLALENVDVDTVNSVEKALTFVKKVNSPWLNLYPDMGNLVAFGYDPVTQLRLAGKYLVSVHIKDALPGEVRGIQFNKGMVPFSETFKTLYEMNFSGPLVVEMWAHLDKTGNPLHAAKEARQFIEQIINAIMKDG